MDSARPRITHNDFIKISCAVMVGHVTVEKNLESIEQVYFWSKLWEDVEYHVRSCVVFQQNKANNKKSVGLLKPFFISKQ